MWKFSTWAASGAFGNSSPRGRRGDLLAIADGLSAQLTAHPRPFGTKNPAALRAWGEALAARNPEDRAAAFRRAIDADPNFGLAYVDLIGLLRMEGKKADASALLDEVRPRLGRLEESDRHRLELQGRRIAWRRGIAPQGTGGGWRRRNPATWTCCAGWPRRRRSPATFRPRRRPIARRWRWHPKTRSCSTCWVTRRLTQVASQKPGQRSNATPRYRRATRIRTIRWVRSNFFFGKFAEAESYFLKASKKGPGGRVPADIQKAALSRVMRGDVAGADALMAELLVPADQMGRASWLALTGREEGSREPAPAAGGQAGSGEPGECTPDGMAGV